MNRLHIVCCIILGSFCVYCGQSVVSDDAGGDAVPPAGAETCCTAPAQGFVKLAEGDLTKGQTTDVIAVGAYREVVIYVAATSQYTCNLQPEFRPDASSPFGLVGNVDFAWGGRLQVSGSDLHLVASSGQTSCSLHYQIAGVQ